MVTQITPIYHITHIDNLRSIILTGGLVACGQLPAHGYTNIANPGIQDRRSRFSVPIDPKGNLHAYVPFYFAPRSPMLYAIHSASGEGYVGGQAPIVYLVSNAQLVQNARLQFVFTDGHAIMRLSNYYDTCDNLHHVDWSIMREKYWNDTPEDGDRKRRRMAEFLVHRYLPLGLVTQIVVYNQQMARRVVEILRDLEIDIEVGVNAGWYY